MSRKKTKDICVFFLQSEAKDLQVPYGENQCRFFASLRMTDFRES